MALRGDNQPHQPQQAGQPQPDQSLSQPLQAPPTRPPFTGRYQQRFDRPFLVAIPRAAVPPGLPQSPNSAAAAAAEAPGVGDDNADAAALPAQDGDAASVAPPPLRFLISLGPSRELQGGNAAVGHVLAGFGVLRHAAQAAQDALAARYGAAAASKFSAAATAAAAAAASAGPRGPRLRVVGWRELPRGEAPVAPAPLMLGAWPAWPEDLPPLERPDMEAEAIGRLEMARGIKAAGNAALTAGDTAAALAHYRQGIRWAELAGGTGAGGVRMSAPSCKGQGQGALHF
jgi:hypothetical protein